MCVCTHEPAIWVYAEFLLRFLKGISNMGLMCLSELIKTLYVTKFLKEQSNAKLSTWLL